LAMTRFPCVECFNQEGAGAALTVDVHSTARRTKVKKLRKLMSNEIKKKQAPEQKREGKGPERDEEADSENLHL
jgi:hypothetical protein